MARIKIDLPPHSLYKTEIAIRITDLNYGGHVGNDNILSLMHECRMRWIRNLGFKDELSIEQHVGLIVADVAIVYKSEAFYGDFLAVNISVGDVSRIGFDMFYEMLNTKTGKEVARGKTGIVCMDYKTRKIALIPERLKSQLGDGNSAH